MIGFEQDHFDLIMAIPLKHAVSDVIEMLKSQSSFHVGKTVKWLGKVYWTDNIVWSTSYFVSSVGIDENVIRNYAEYQGQMGSDQFRMEP